MSRTDNLRIKRTRPLIAPAILEEEVPVYADTKAFIGAARARIADIVHGRDERLLVGNATRDDAAVYDLGNGRGVISTTDFFMPIVDDPFDFGRIAVTNAISDIYAMGGTPLLAIAVLGWPTDKLPASVASAVVDGGRHTFGCGEPRGRVITDLETFMRLTGDRRPAAGRYRCEDCAPEDLRLFS